MGEVKQISPNYPAGGALAHPLPKHHQRFTLDGSDELENHLGAVCEKVLEGVLHLFPEHNLEALLLGGG